MKEPTNRQYNSQKMLRRIKRHSGKTFKQIGDHADQVCRKDKHISLRRTDWFVNGCGMSLQGLVVIDQNKERLMFTPSGQCFKIAVAGEIKTE